MLSEWWDQSAPHGLHYRGEEEACLLIQSIHPKADEELQDYQVSMLKKELSLNGDIPKLLKTKYRH